MIGSTTSPGMIQSEATENPMDRARGGMASDSDAKMSGSIFERLPVMIALATIATPMLGASANTIRQPDTSQATLARNPMMRLGSRATSFVPMRAPMMSPTSWKGSTDA